VKAEDIPPLTLESSLFALAGRFRSRAAGPGASDKHRHLGAKGAPVLLDSSAIPAVLDASDTHHARALRTSTDLARLRCRVFQTTFP